MARRRRASRELFHNPEWVEYAIDWRRTYGFEASVEALQAAFREPQRRQLLDSDVYFTEAESDEIARVEATFEQRPDVRRWLPADAVERHFIDMEFDRRPPGGLWRVAFTHRAEEYVELLREHYPDPSKLVAATRPHTARALNRVEAEVRAAENEIGREIWQISTAPMEGLVKVELDSDDHRYSRREVERRWGDMVELSLTEAPLFGLDLTAPITGRPTMIATSPWLAETVDRFTLKIAYAGVLSPEIERQIPEAFAAALAGTTAPADLARLTVSATVQTGHFGHLAITLIAARRDAEPWIQAHNMPATIEQMLDRLEPSG